MSESAADRTEPTAWVRIPSEEDARRDLPSDYAYDDALVSPFLRLVQAHRGISEVFWPLETAVMQGDEDSRLSPREREMIAVAAAVAQDCDYWIQTHAEFLRVRDGGEDLVKALKERNWLGLPSRDATLCAVADKISGDPTRMTEADWQPVRDLGLGDRECMEIAHIVGFMNYATRLADGLGLETDPGFIK